MLIAAIIAIALALFAPRLLGAMLGCAASAATSAFLVVPFFLVLFFVWLNYGMQ